MEKDGGHVSSYLEGLLRFDPVDVAEKLTGGSVHDDEATQLTTLAIALSHTERLQGELASRGDSHFGMSLDAYLSLVQGVGFQVVLEERFESPRNAGEWGRMFVLFEPRRAIVLVFDTYYEWSSKVQSSVNSGNFYYNWRPSGSNKYRYTSSGGWGGDVSSGAPSDVWVGYHDCREAIIHKIKMLDQGGTFVNPWEFGQWIWLLNWGDKQENGELDLKRIDRFRRERFARLPDSVRSVVRLDR